MNGVHVETNITSEQARKSLLSCLCFRPDTVVEEAPIPPPPKSHPCFLPQPLPSIGTKVLLLTHAVRSGAGTALLVILSSRGTLELTSSCRCWPTRIANKSPSAGRHVVVHPHTEPAVSLSSCRTPFPPPFPLIRASVRQLIGTPAGGGETGAKRA